MSLSIDLIILVVYLLTATVLFDRGRVPELMLLSVTAVVFNGFFGGYLSQISTESITPLSVSIYVALYALVGFFTTLVWWVAFSFSVKRKYLAFLDSGSFKMSVKELLQQYTNSCKEYQCGEWGVESVAELNAQVRHLVSGEDIKEIMAFGPTTELVHHYNPPPERTLNIGRVLVWSPKDCEVFIARIFPPDVLRFKDVLLLVCVMWPVALTWLLFYSIAKAGFTFMVERLTKVYDKLASKAFGGLI